MSNPYFACYPTDFLADVGHLGNTELGIYWRLLLVYYRDGRPLPFDMDRLRRIAMTFSPEEYRCLEQVVTEFFVLTTEPDGTRVWRHRRADKELKVAAEKHDAAKKKAVAAAGARWAKPKNATSNATGNAPSMRQAVLQQCQPEPEPEPEPEPVPTVAETGGTSQFVAAHSADSAPRKRSADKPASRGQRLPQGWALPKAWGEWAVDELAMPAEQVRSEAAKFADYWHAKTGRDATKADWQATWRNWCRTALERAPRQRVGHAAFGGRPSVDPAADKARAARILGFDPPGHDGLTIEGEVLP